MAACCGVDGCWDQAEVNIGWYGYHTKVPTTVLTGPGMGVAKDSVPAGKRIGRQSVRNPTAGDQPSPRNGRNGYSFCYVIETGATGWIADADIEPYNVNAGGTFAWATGPAGSDFHVNNFGAADEPGFHCTKGSPVGCGGSSITGRRTIGAADVYLRYAPHSTAFYYLEHGDTVDQACQAGGGFDFRCVTVVSSRLVPAGTKGWILTGALA